MSVAYFDLETHLIRPRHPFPKIVCVSFAFDEGTPQIVLRRDPAFVDVLGKVLSAEVVVGHSISFDMGCLLLHCPELSPLVWKAYDTERVVCTQVRAQLHAAAEGVYKVIRKFSMESLTKHLLERPSHKSDVRLRFAELDGLPLDAWPPQAMRYCMEDIEVTRELYHKLPRAGDETRHIRAAMALRLACAQAPIADLARVQTLREQTEAEIAELEAQLTKAEILRADGTKDLGYLRAMVQQLCKDADIEVPETPTGQVAVSRIALESLKDNEHIAVLLDRERLAKVKTTFLPVLEQAAQKALMPGFNPVLESGRASYFKPNLQQIPRSGGVRPCFIPRPGCVFISADWASAELRTLAQQLVTWFGKSKLADVLNAGHDPHVLMAGRLMGISEEAALSRGKNDPELRRWRNPLAKNLNFGGWGGLGPATFVKTCAAAQYPCTIEEARRFLLVWREAWSPDTTRYFERCNQLVREGGNVEINGFVRGGLRYTQVCNTHFQTPVAQAAKDAAWWVTWISHHFPNMGLYGAKVVMFLHDELIIEVAKERAEEAALELMVVMRDCMDELTPDVPSVVEVRVADCWDEK